MMDSDYATWSDWFYFLDLLKHLMHNIYHKQSCVYSTAKQYKTVVSEHTAVSTTAFAE